jgi:hypothetical protein
MRVRPAPTVIDAEVALVMDPGLIRGAWPRMGEVYSPVDLLSSPRPESAAESSVLRTCGLRRLGRQTIHDLGIAAQITPKHHHRVPL